MRTSSRHPIKNPKQIVGVSDVTACARVVLAHHRRLAAGQRDRVLTPTRSASDAGGLKATRALMARAEPPRVIVLTTFDADVLVLEALGAGADGFLLKDTPPPQIVSAIRRVADGEPMLSPSVTRTVLSRLRDDDDRVRSREARRRLATLTDRERDVALAVGRGLSNSDIARELHLSVATVKGHVVQLFRKLDVVNRVQVALWVHDARLQ